MISSRFRMAAVWPLLALWLAASAPGVSAGAATALEYSVRGLRVALPIFSIFARPGELLDLDLLGQQASRFRLSLKGEILGGPDLGRWRFEAPSDPGLYPLRLQRADSGQAVTLNLFVGHPVEGINEGSLNDYLIGPQPPLPARHAPLYRPPQAYFEVTADNVDTRLSPHFTLRQFLCKQPSDFPKYVVLREPLLLLLEGLLQNVREAGYPVETLGVISGYRTPSYNKSIGNVSNSRHVYGDAFDFFVDADGDGRMDDLNGNGRHDRADVDLLAGIVDRFMRRPDNAAFLGGMGRYYKTSRHGGFVHADTRGFVARW